MESARPGPDETLLTPPTVAGGLFGADQSDESVDGDDLVFERLMRWETAYLRGEDPAPESICRDEPALVEILGDWIAKRKKLYGLIGLRELADGVGADRDSLPDIPGHELIREIGRGGMGVVYLARDRRLGRIVAIKTIAQARLATADQINRFLLEARAVAPSEHHRDPRDRRRSELSVPLA